MDKVHLHIKKFQTFSPLFFILKQIVTIFLKACVIIYTIISDY